MPKKFQRNRWIRSPQLKVVQNSAVKLFWNSKHNCSEVERVAYSYLSAKTVCYHLHTDLCKFFRFQNNQLCICSYTAYSCPPTWWPKLFFAYIYLVKRLIVTLRCAVNVNTSSF